MNTNIIRVGFDSDDAQYHRSTLDKNTGEVIEFKCRPTQKGLLSELCANDRLTCVSIPEA